MKIDIPSTLTYAWAVPGTVFLMYWALERSYTFTMPLERIKIANEKFGFIPIYSNGTLFQEASEALTGAYSAFFDTKRYIPDRLHIWSCLIMSFLIVGNLAFGDQVR